MIDQRILPASFVYMPFTSAAEVAAGIKDMVVRGAPAIGCAAAYGIALEAARLRNKSTEDFQSGLTAAFALLSASRPTAVNLFWALERMRRVVEKSGNASPTTIADTLLREAHEVLAEDIRVNRAIGNNGMVLLDDGARVLTHCNAGALATGGYGTALGVIRSAVAAGKKVSVIVDETRPFLQGARLTAWEMVQEKIPVTVITDSMAGHLMARGEVDAVIVGADRVAANGDVANKIGSYSLAVLARHHGIPFYVACPLSTIDLQTKDGAEIPIEERASSEVTGYRDTQWAPAGVSVRNPGFDVTPAELIEAIVTEKGVVRNPDERGIRALFEAGDELPTSSRTVRN
jgi:methylthioribose-1-phosphate isomerase